MRSVLMLIGPERSRFGMKVETTCVVELRECFDWQACFTNDSQEIVIVGNDDWRLPVVMKMVDLAAGDGELRS